MPWLVLCPATAHSFSLHTDAVEVVACKHPISGATMALSDMSKTLKMPLQEVQVLLLMLCPSWDIICLVYTSLCCDVIKMLFQHGAIGLQVDCMMACLASVMRLPDSHLYGCGPWL